MKRILLAVVAVFCLSVFCSADIITYTVVLNGASESPSNASLGTGNGLVTINTVANTMRVQVSFSGLSGTTTASHIHCCTGTAFTGTAGVATTTPTFAGFPLGVTSGTYDNTLDLLSASSYNPAFVTANGNSIAGSEAALLNAMAGGKTYLNIHTTVVPGGEIRGFLTATPEPASVLLLSTGLAGLGALIRRKRL